MPEPTKEILPDEILDKHFETAPKPTAKESAPPADDLDDTGDELTDEDDLEDTGDDDAGEEESDRELDEDDDLDDDDEDLDDLDDEFEDDEELDDDDDEDDDLDDDDEEGEEAGTVSGKDAIGGKLSKEERELIEKTPELKKLARSLQADYTRKNMEVAENRKQVNRFIERVRTPEGAVDFIKSEVLRNPMVVATAFEAIATGDGAKDFLVEVGLEQREVFEQAYERLQELFDDDDARTRHVEDRDREREKQELREEKKQRANEKFRERLGEIQSEAESLSKKAGIDPDDLDEVIGAVKARIKEKGEARQGWDLSRDEIKQTVLAVRKDIKAREAKVAKKLERQQLKRSREGAKKRARKGSKRRSAPRSSSGAGSRKLKGFKPPKGVDPLDAFVNAALDV